MKAVLENVSYLLETCKRVGLLAHKQPEPLQNLSNLVKAQLIYHSTAAETLSVSFFAYVCGSWDGARACEADTNRASRRRLRKSLLLPRPSTDNPVSPKRFTAEGQSVDSEGSCSREVFVAGKGGSDVLISKRLEWKWLEARDALCAY